MSVKGPWMNGDNRESLYGVGGILHRCLQLLQLACRAFIIAVAT